MSLWNRFKQFPHFAFIVLILANLVVAAFVFDDYGESWDEPNIYLYAEATESAYQFGLHGYKPVESQFGPYNLRNYGPVYFVLSNLFAKGVGALAPQLLWIDLWHLSYFLAFLLAVGCLYALCLRWVSPPAALGAALLFNLQPLLWGHAFINPKDIPMLGFFLLSVVLGLRAADVVNEDGLRPWLAAALAGLALGVTTAMRVSAPFAGVLVALAFLARGRRRAVPLLGLYAAVAIFGAVTLWPYLWEAPLSRFLGVIDEMRQFPLDLQVLFNGAHYSSLALPLDYLPRLLALQLTLPAWLLILLGLGVSVWRATRRRLQRPFQLALLAAWFLLPVAAILALRPTMYDDFRQFLFILPPLFVLAALALDELLVRLKPLGFALLLALACAPALLSMLALHPYEYAYYNRLAGSPAQAAQRYESEYWLTSYKAAIEYLNREAPPRATVFVFGEGGPKAIFDHYSRPNLIGFSSGGYAYGSGNKNYDYALLTTRYDAAGYYFDFAPVVFQVERQGVPFVVVKDLRAVP